MSAEPLFDEERKSRVANATIVDISERKKAAVGYCMLNYCMSWVRYIRREAIVGHHSNHHQWRCG
jgi:hypothetical protein